METCLIEKTRFVFITNIGRELVIIFYFLVMSDNICYVYFFENYRVENPLLKFGIKK